MGFQNFLKTTQHNRKYWKGRKIDWLKAYGPQEPEHPHRAIIVQKLRQFQFRSVLEVGCAAGANIYRIKQTFPHADVGGIDWNEDAIAVAKTMLPKAAVIQVGEADDIYISSHGADVILSDMCFIYLGKKDFRRTIKEMKRIARNGVLFCEFHEPKWWKRLMIKFATGYNAYNYKKELERVGFYDVEIQKLTPKDWPGTEKEKGLRCIITAKP